MLAERLHLDSSTIYGPILFIFALGYTWSVMLVLFSGLCHEKAMILKEKVPCGTKKWLWLGITRKIVKDGKVMIQVGWHAKI